jgi:hypothetical protein
MTPNVSRDTLWLAEASALIARFHASQAYGDEQKSVERALLELVAQHIERELGTEADWDALDIAGFVETTFVFDDGYRERLRATLSRFYDFLLGTGRLKPLASTRIQREIEATLSDAPPPPARDSVLRGLGSAPTPIDSRRAK